MSDELDMRVPADRTLVNTADKWELEYWCAEWGCTEAELLAFVGKFGTNVDALDGHLKAISRLCKSQDEPN